MSTQQLKNVATGKQAQRTDSFPHLLETHKAEIAKALPRHLKPDTMLRIALTAFRLNPKLGQCEPASVFAAVIQASQLGLRPNLLGECYLIPYKDRNGKMQCQLQIGYQGLLELVRRSGLVESIGCYLVHTRDDFKITLGTDPGIYHVPFMDGDRGEVKLGYAVAKIKGGGLHVEVMTVEQINAIKARSQNVIAAAKYDSRTPWDTDWDEMARKTLARRICKWLPKSNELATALSLENAADKGTQELTVDDAIHGAFVPIAEPEEEAPAKLLSADYYEKFLREATTLDELQKRWKHTIDAYADGKQEMPVEVEASHIEMREHLKDKETK